ncbi:hypothetical protein LINGRAHAP2_LOCUS8313 [Linum grandiflorum]
MYRCTITIVDIEREQPWSYRACPECSYAVIAYGTDFWCKKHDTVLSKDTISRFCVLLYDLILFYFLYLSYALLFIFLKYRLKLSVSDPTTKTTFILLGHTADRIMPIHAFDLAMAYSDAYGELPPPIQILIGQQVTFGIYLPRQGHTNAYDDFRIAKIWGLFMPRAQLIAQLPPPPVVPRSPSPPARHDTPIPPDPAYVPPIPTFQKPKLLQLQAVGESFPYPDITCRFSCLRQPRLAK